MIMLVVMPQWWWSLMRSECCHLALATTPYTTPQQPQQRSTPNHGIWKPFTSRFLPSRRARFKTHDLLRFFERGGSFPSSSDAAASATTSSSRWNRKARHNNRRRRLDILQQQEESPSSSKLQNQKSVDFYHDDPQIPGWKRIWQHISPSLPQGRQWARWVASGVQMGLVLYLLGAVFHALKEALEEVAASADPSNSLEPSLFSKDDVSSVMEHLRNLPATTADGETDAKESTASASPASSRGGTYSVALSLAELLLFVGIPLQSQNGINASVENILSSITRSEANLLRECIWLRKEPPTKMWNRVIGLGRVQQGLMSALATVKQQSSHSYSSLFDNSSAGVLLYGPYVCVFVFNG